MIIICTSREGEPFQPPVMFDQLQRNRTDHHTLGCIVLLLRMHPHNSLIQKPDIQTPDSCNEVQRQAAEGDQKTPSLGCFAQCAKHCNANNNQQ
jgi:hypothetical protein